MERPSARDVTLAGLAGWALCLATAIWAVRGESLGGVISALGFAAIPLALPFIVLAVAARMARNRTTRVVLLVGVALALAWWLYAFAETYVFPERLDAQSGLVFLAAPIYAVIAALIVSAVALAVERFASR
jgi:hypothetical protein